jgi:hypothetical protein
MSAVRGCRIAGVDNGVQEPFGAGWNSTVYSGCASCMFPSAAGGNVSQRESQATASGRVAVESETRRLAHGTRHVSAADPSPPAGLFGGEQVRIRA